jgi:predicted PurR-regulated permease PerM
VAFKPSPEAEARISQLLKRLSSYMSIKTMTSLATGVLIWGWLAFLGSISRRSGACSRFC